jgi:hypothetical protein
MSHNTVRIFGRGQVEVNVVTSNAGYYILIIEIFSDYYIGHR